MNILLVYPKYPDTFWSFRHALKFISKKANTPPLGLLTIASMLPRAWNVKLVDMNIEKLRKKHIIKADYVFISAMSVQHESVKSIIAKCKKLNTRIVAGGPLFTEDYKRFPEVDHFVLNEAEITLDQFIHDLNAGIPKKFYQSSVYASLKETPIPDYSLLKLSKYASLSIQYTRGCPFNCEFCDVTALFGHKVRSKSVSQIILELNNIHKYGWNGNVFFVDDNFIGNAKELKNHVLPAMIQWMEDYNHPFILTTEASINLADDPELMSLMVRAGFRSVFVGIETPVKSSLAECNKVQNKNREMLESVELIQKAGMEVMAGFIVGFDSDPSTVFDQQIEFIQNSGIITAMVGLLNAPTKTRLYNRLEKEGRILKEFDGDNTNFSLNFIPKMDATDLIKGYKRILKGIYDPKPYYDRVFKFMNGFTRQPVIGKKISFSEIMAVFKSIFWIGLFDRSRWQYWQLFFWCLFKKPKAFPRAITYSIYGYHFRKVFKEN